MRKLDIIVSLACALLLLLLLILALVAPPSSQPARVAVDELEVAIEVEPLPVKEPEMPQPEPEPKPEPEPPTPSKPEPPPPAPSEAPVSEPVESQTADSGAMPPLQANYRSHVGFQRYADAMLRVGADFFVTAGKQGTLLRIDFTSRSLIEVPVSLIAQEGYSPRTRVIGDEPALNRYLQLARENHQTPDPQIIMLVPQHLEAHIAARLAAALKPHGADIGEVNAVRGVYRLQGSRLLLQITRAETARGTLTINVPIRI